MPETSSRLPPKAFLFHDEAVHVIEISAYQYSTSGFHLDLEDQRNKDLMFQEFVKDFTQRYKSLVSNIFYGTNCNVTQCTQCNTQLFNYQVYFFMFKINYMYYKSTYLFFSC